jgi:hypothetical protein
MMPWKLQRQALEYTMSNRCHVLERKFENFFITKKI